MPSWLNISMSRARSFISSYGNVFIDPEGGRDPAWVTEAGYNVLHDYGLSYAPNTFKWQGDIIEQSVKSGDPREIELRLVFYFDACCVSIRPLSTSPLRFTSASFVYNTVLNPAARKVSNSRLSASIMWKNHLVGTLAVDGQRVSGAFCVAHNFVGDEPGVEHFDNARGRHSAVAGRCRCSGVA